MTTGQINPSIPLGITPPQPSNLLGMYGQMLGFQNTQSEMALRQAATQNAQNQNQLFQRDFAAKQAVANAYSKSYDPAIQGVDPTKLISNLQGTPGMIYAPDVLKQEFDRRQQAITLATGSQALATRMFDKNAQILGGLQPSVLGRAATQDDVQKAQSELYNWTVNNSDIPDNIKANVKNGILSEFKNIGELQGPELQADLKRRWVATLPPDQQLKVMAGDFGFQDTGAAKVPYSRDITSGQTTTGTPIPNQLTPEQRTDVVSGIGVQPAVIQDAQGNLVPNPQANAPISTFRGNIAGGASGPVPNQLFPSRGAAPSQSQVPAGANALLPGQPPPLEGLEPAPGPAPNRIAPAAPGGRVIAGVQVPPRGQVTTTPLAPGTPSGVTSSFTSGAAPGQAKVLEQNATDFSSLGKELGTRQQILNTQTQALGEITNLMSAPNLNMGPGTDTRNKLASAFTAIGMPDIAAKFQGNLPAAQVLQSLGAENVLNRLRTAVAGSKILATEVDNYENSHPFAEGSGFTPQAAKDLFSLYQKINTIQQMETDYHAKMSDRVQIGRMQPVNPSQFESQFTKFYHSPAGQETLHYMTGNLYGQ